MDYFDKKINDIYNRPEENLPTDLSWESMEESIYAHMEDDKPKRKVFWFWLGGGLGLLIATILFAIYPANSPKKIIDSTPRSSEVKIATEKSINTISTIKENQNTTDSSIQSTNTLSSKSNQIVKANTSHTKNKNSAVVNKQIEDRSATTFITKDNSEINEYALIDESTSSLNIIKTNVDTKREFITNENIALLDSKFITKESSAPTSNLKSLNISSIHEDETEHIRNNNYQLEFSSGTSLNSRFGIENENYNKALPGYSARIGLNADRKSGWGYQIGLSHSLLVEKFDLDLTDTISTHVSNVAIRTLTNSVTGQVTTVYGDAYRESRRYRKELSYNTINLISLDAAINKRITISKKWLLKPSMGIQYDRLISLEGKTLDNENEILEYDMDTSDIRKNLISGSVGIQLEYNITNRWSLMTSATHTYSLNNIYSNGRQLRATYLRGGIIYNM